MLSLPASIAAGTGLGVGGGFSRSVLSHRTNKNTLSQCWDFLVPFNGMCWEILFMQNHETLKDWLTNAKNYHSFLRHVKFLKEIQGVQLFSDPQILPEQNVPRRERFGCCTWFRITFHNSHEYVPCIYI